MLLYVIKDTHTHGISKKKEKFQNNTMEKLFQKMNLNSIYITIPKPVFLKKKDRFKNSHINILIRNQKQFNIFNKKHSVFTNRVFKIFY